MEVTYGRGYVYSIQYHIVWCVKYRHPILTNEVEKRLFEILYKIAEDNKFWRGQNGVYKLQANKSCKRFGNAAGTRV